MRRQGVTVRTRRGRLLPRSKEGEGGILPGEAADQVLRAVGGIIRDVLAGEPSILLRPELYVTAAALAAALFVILAGLGVPLIAAALIGAVSGFGLRALAITRGLAIPSYKR